MKRLLMIDDDEKLVSLVRKYLEPHGFEVENAYDGEAGLATACEREPALVILDLMLPGLDGLEVCRRLREQSRVPVLMLTASGDETDRIVGLELGADDYLPKPFNPRELLARIRAILRRSQDFSTGGSVSATTIRVGPLAVDPATRAVSVAGKEVSLTTTEFDLLHTLAASAGRVLSREQLMDRVYGAEWQAYDRSIDVHISRIRHKIGDDPRRPRLLKTVRGIGYQLARLEES
jgi:DNA-binding response OmpR family regulator